MNLGQVLMLAIVEGVTEFLIGNTGVTLWALFVGGIILIFWEKKRSIPALGQGYSLIDNARNIPFFSAFKIGIFQLLSMIPGVSRAAATIIVGMAVGLSRESAVEFSFLLAIPTMAAATGLDLIKSGWRFSIGEFGLIGMGFVGSFLVAAATVKWLTGFVKSRTLAVFGWYRIFLAVLWWLA